MNILLVGCGKMGSALLLRWRELQLYKDICVVDPGDLAVAGFTHARSFAGLPQDFSPDIIIFAVKPQILPEVIGDYRALAQKALVISIAAGKPVSFFEQHLGDAAKIVRTMPNTPAAIGHGITVACANTHVDALDRETASSLLSAVGEVLWVENESLLDPVTALSGSGPAYVFLLIEAMAAAGVKARLDPVMAEKLARQTVIGSALLAQQSAETPASTLRENVTSPNGTTAAALAVLMAKDGGLQDLFDKAIEAATQRARELSK